MLSSGRGNQLHPPLALLPMTDGQIVVRQEKQASSSLDLLISRPFELPLMLKKTKEVQNETYEVSFSKSDMLKKKDRLTLLRIRR